MGRKKKIRENEQVIVSNEKVQNKGVVIQAVKQEMPQMPQVTAQTIKDYLFGTNTNLTEQQMALAINTAVMWNLNPFKREIHFVAFKDKYGNSKVSLITGYDVYIKRADRTGKLDGWKAWIDKKNGETYACIEIKRKDFSTPFYHEVNMKEFKQNSPIWDKMPEFMIKKVAIAQGFRLAFPDELGGMPYTADELPSEMAGVAGNGAISEQKAPAGTTPNLVAKRDAEMDDKLDMGDTEIILPEVKKMIAPTKDELIQAVKDKGLNVHYIGARIATFYKKELYEELSDKEKLELYQWVQGHVILETKAVNK